MKNKAYEYIAEFKRNDNTVYMVRIPYVDNLGIHRWYKKAFSAQHYGSDEEALRCAMSDRDSVMEKLPKDKVFTAKCLSVGEVYDLMIRHRHISTVSEEKTRDLYNAYISSIIGSNRAFADVTKEDIQKCLDAATNDSSNNAAQFVLSILKDMFKTAIVYGCVEDDNTLGLILPAFDPSSEQEKRSQHGVKSKKRRTSFDELNNALDDIDRRIQNKRDSFMIQAALMIMCYTGMRICETLELERKHIDIERRSIFVRNRSTVPRILHMAEELVPVSQELIDSAKGEHLFIGDNGQMMTGEKLSFLTWKATDGAFRPFMCRKWYIEENLSDSVAAEHVLRTFLALP